MRKILHTTLALILSLLVVAQASPSKSEAKDAEKEEKSQSLAIEPLNSPAGPASSEPNFYVASDGRIFLVWLEPAADKRTRLRFASLKSGAWSEPRTIIESQEMFVNPANFPSIVALPGGSLVAQWLNKGEPGTHASDVVIARSNDGGKTWTRPIIPHRDGTKTEHGFVSMLSWSENRALAFWLDGRETVGRTHNRAPNEPPKPPKGATGLRYAYIDVAGQASEDLLIDPKVCDCCQTSAAVTSEGAIIAYRDRSEKEIRDISVIRFVNGKWTEPQSVSDDGWEIYGCPVNGPAMDADGRRVAIAWYTAPKEAPQVKVSFSGDAGRSFGQAVRVDDGNAAGRVDVAWLADGSALVSWVERTATGGDIKVRRVRPDGTRDQAIKLGESTNVRATGFPQMARAGSDIYIAWTEAGQPSQVRLAVARLAGKKR